MLDGDGARAKPQRGESLPKPAATLAVPDEAWRYFEKREKVISGALMLWREGQCRPAQNSVVSPPL